MKGYRGTPGARPPVAPPFDITYRPASSQASTSRAESRGTNTASRAVPAQRAELVRRIGARQRDRIGQRLSQRDWNVLRRIREHRFLTTDQVQHFVFTGHASRDTAARTTRSVLTRLKRDGLLRSLTRQVGGLRGGSTPHIWQLAPAGARLLRPADSGYRVSLPTTRFLAHCLTVADAHLGVRAAAGRVDGQATVKVEQAARRHYLNSGGSRVVLRPDLHAVVGGTDDDGAYEDCWFIEVDLGTESLPTLVAKCTQYETYRASGAEQSEFGAFPLVLWVMHGHRAEVRRDELRRRIARTPRLTPALYRVVLAEDLPDLLVSGGIS